MKITVLGQCLTVVLASGLFINSVNAVENDVAVELLQRLNELEQEVSTLRGKNEELVNELDSVRKNQREGFLQVDERVQKLESNTNETPADKSTEDKSSAAPKTEEKTQQSENNESSLSEGEIKVNPSATNEMLRGADSYYYYGTEGEDGQGAEKPQKPETPPTAITRQAVLNSPSAPVNPPPAVAEPAMTNTPPPAQVNNNEIMARDSYNEAYKTLLSEPRLAVPAFQDFLQRFPGHPLSANAQYWIGEAMYAQQNYSRATEEFMKVLKQYKDSSKAPDAALKLGYSFYELKQWDLARRTLEDTIRFFPDSNAANLAAGRLEQLTSQGY